jgi:hypothetical protein
VCCEVGFEDPTVHPLLELMPEVLLVRRGGIEDPSLPVLLETTHPARCAGVRRCSNQRGPETLPAADPFASAFS